MPDSHNSLSEIPGAIQFAWSDLKTDGAPRALAASSQAFRLAVTLDGAKPFAAPDLSKAPGLIGPITDLMTFYADLFLAMHKGALGNSGDHVYFSSSTTASWADGNVVVLGEDHVDFDITLTQADNITSIASFVVKHVPPQSPKIHLPVDWMHSPVADTPNNFVQVQRTAAGFDASVGKETFDVTLLVDIRRGTIVSASMDNPVTMVTRTCSDITLTRCGEVRATPIVRRVELLLGHDR